MITAKEIETLKKDIDSRTLRLREGFASGENNNPDRRLSELSDTPGWEIVKAAFDSIIWELLEPEEFDGSTEAYVVSRESKRLTIHALRSIMGVVESAKAARAAEKTSEGVSE